MANKVSNPPSINDGIMRYLCSKVPDSKIKIQDFNQNLSDGVEFSTTEPIASSWMGNPTSLTLFIYSDTASTIYISLSADGTRWYSASVQTLTAGESTIVTLPGAGYIQLTTTENITVFNADVVAHF